MNYDRRYSPQLASNEYSTRTMNQRDSRSQQNTPRGGFDSRAQYYGREYPPLRSRSQNNVEQEYGDRYSQQAPPPQFYDNRTLDKNLRSKSLDAREFRGDDGFYREDPQGGVIIPIRRETARSRISDVRSSPQVRPREFDTYQPQFDQRRQFGAPQAGGAEVNIPYNRDLTNRDRDFGPQPRQSYDFGPDHGKSPFGQFRDGDSPKSHSSRLQDNRRALGYIDDRGPLGYGNDFDRERDRDRDDFNAGTIQPYRGPPGFVGAGTGAGQSGAYRSSSHHRSHHESYGGGHESSFAAPGGPGRVITQQPQMFHADGRPMRPIQHHRVQCCCFRFVWPPWSYEQAPPPQQIYRNI